MNNGSSTVSILLGNGDGTFGATHNFPAGDYPGPIAVGDFYGDGKPDLAVADNFGSDILGVLPGNGDGTFRMPVNYTVGANPYAIAVADFNGDGRTDLAVANFSQLGVSILLGAAPTVSVTPPELAFTSVLGGPAPASQTLTVLFPGVVTAAATTNTPPNINWLAVAIGPPNTATGRKLIVTAVPTGLSAGVYTGQITVSASGDSSVPPQVIPVTYTITTPYVPPPVAGPQITSGCPVSPVAQNSSLMQTLLATGGGGIVYVDTGWELTGGALADGKHDFRHGDSRAGSLQFRYRCK